MFVAAKRELGHKTSLCLHGQSMLVLKILASFFGSLHHCCKSQQYENREKSQLLFTWSVMASSWWSTRCISKLACCWSVTRSFCSTRAAMASNCGTNELRKVSQLTTRGSTVVVTEACVCRRWARASGFSCKSTNQSSCVWVDTYFATQITLAAWFCQLSELLQNSTSLQWKTHMPWVNEMCYRYSHAHRSNMKPCHACLHCRETSFSTGLADQRSPSHLLLYKVLITRSSRGYS